MLTINQNQNINIYTPVFKGSVNSSNPYKSIRKSLENITLEEQEMITPKKVVNRVKKLDKEAVKNAGKFIGALGKISVGFAWNRLKNLGIALATWPVVLLGGLVLETGLTLMISQNIRHRDGNYKYKIEQIDKKAETAESYYDSDIEKYYKETGDVIFDYLNAISQMETEKQQVQEAINSVKEGK